MLVDHSASVPIKEGDAQFLSVKAGITEIVKHLPEIGQSDQPEGWWMADVIFVEVGARNPKVPTLFQVGGADSGVVRWVNADLVTQIVSRV